jgi:hypothetical protein
MVISRADYLRLGETGQTLSREMGCASPRLYAQFPQNILHVFVHGALGRSDLGCNFRIALANHEPVQHLAFAGSQTERPRTASIRRFLSLRRFPSGPTVCAFKMNPDLLRKEPLPGPQPGDI